MCVRSGVVLQIHYTLTIDQCRSGQLEFFVNPVQLLTIPSSIDGLTTRKELLVDNSVHIPPDTPQNLTRGHPCLSRGTGGAARLRPTSFSLRVIVLDPSFITGYQTVKERGLLMAFEVRNASSNSVMFHLGSQIVRDPLA